MFAVPGLAFKPRLAFHPVSILALPFASLVVVLIFQASLAAIGAYQPTTVRLLSAGLAAAAIWRLYSTYKLSGIRHGWSHYHAQVFIIALALCIYFSPMLLVYGFDKDDEIYSWNMWAIQHFLGEPIDFSYTGAPYPQLFPRMLSFAYMLLGSVEYQTAVKTSLIAFPFLFFAMLGMASSGSRYLFLVMHIALSLFVLREMDMKHMFDDGMPDTMMSVGVVLSVYFFLLYRASPQRTGYLWLAVVSSAIATLTKQPALVWSMASMPLLMAHGVFRQGFRKRDFAIALIPAVVGAIWMLSEGHNFHNNAGVTGRSFADRDYIEQLLFSFRLYFLDDWKLPVLYLLGTASCFRDRSQLGALLLFTLPSTAAWLLFAAYDLRAGIPAILSMCLFIAHGNYLFGSSSLPTVNAAPGRMVTYSVLLMLTVFALSDADSALEKHGKKEDPGFKPGMPLRNNFARMFPDDVDKLYQQLIKNDEAKIWTPTHYVYGLLYGYADVARPGHRKPSYSVQELLEELRANTRNFVTNAGNVPAGPAGALIDDLATRLCPAMFQLVSGPGNMHGLLVYRLDTDLLHSNYCRPDPV